MLSIDISQLWGDDLQQIVKAVNEATNNVVAYCKNKENSPKLLKDLKKDICVVCMFWVGNTYVGERKDPKVINAFQSFFEALMNLLLKLKESKKGYEAKFAKSLLYRGMVYRYLGNDSSNNSGVVPMYDNIYVSWSKNQKNTYLESKLCGTITWISCEIVEPVYGIDLENMGVSRGEEREVVFPTIEKYIIQIKYISEYEDD